jgi:hypothetical protein
VAGKVKLLALKPMMWRESANCRSLVGLRHLNEGDETHGDDESVDGTYKGLAVVTPRKWLGSVG